MNRIRTLCAAWAVVASATLLGGCETPIEAETHLDTEAPDQTRGAWTQHYWGSCTLDDCGGRASTGNCWCDDLCQWYGDCCDNAENLCQNNHCIDDAECGDDFYCERPGTSCTHWGECTPRPEVCAEVYDPVCGCDDVTYDNECEAQMAGTSVASEGPCQATCGGFLGLPCDDHTQCVDDPDDDCDPTQGGADCPGICIGFCGGIAGFPCDPGYTCVDDPSDDCDPAKGGADCPGVCQ